MRIENRADGLGNRTRPVPRSDGERSLFQDLPEGPHGIAVAIERALRASGFLADGWEVEPPDSEEHPDNFGLSHEGDLLYIVQVQSW